MDVAWGVVVIALSALCWLGQVAAASAPDTAIRWGLMEARSEVEPAFWADARAEARWDAISLWPMLVAGVLVASGHDAWPYFGLVGGGTYLYFAGRGIAVRVTMRREGFRIGSPESVRVAMIALAAWGVMAAVTIVAAVVTLEGG